MNRIWVILFLQLSMYAAFASDRNPVEMDLWPNGAPGVAGAQIETQTNDDYSVAKLYIYHPDRDKNTRAAVIVCPGGGYGMLAIGYEGHVYARWLADNGITGIVLKYRLPRGQHSVPLRDAQRAVRVVRSEAVNWGVNPSKIGISGFSAGGHLASTAGTHFDGGNSAAIDPIDRFGCRPDFMILFYPVITMKEEFTHTGSRRNLMGGEYNADLVNLYSNEEQVNRQTPPAFIITSDDDEMVLPRNSVEFYSALKRHNIPAVLYVIPDGGHGWGAEPEKPQFAEWSIPLKAWLKKTVLK